MTHNRHVIIIDDVITGDVIIMTHKLLVTKSQKIIKLKIAQSCGGIIFLSGLVLDFDQQKNQSLEFQKFFRVVYTTKTCLWPCLDELQTSLLMELEELLQPNVVS